MLSSKQIFVDLRQTFNFLQRVTEWYARSSIFSKVNCWHIIMPLINGIKFEKPFVKKFKGRKKMLKG